LKLQIPFIIVLSISEGISVDPASVKAVNGNNFLKWVLKIYICSLDLMETIATMKDQVHAMNAEVAKIQQLVDETKHELLKA
jgi:hypothetical protein